MSLEHVPGRNANGASGGRILPHVVRDVDPVLSYEEAGEIIGISSWTIRRRVADGSLKAIKMSRRRVGIRLSEVRRYLDNCEAVAA